MTLRVFLDRTRGVPQVALRTAMVRAIGGLRPRRVLDPGASAEFYRAVTWLLEARPASPAGSGAARREAMSLSRPADGPCDHGLLPYRQLAIRVLEHALHDLVGPSSRAERQSAQRFFAHSRMLRHWCGVAGIDANRVVSRLRPIVAPDPPVAPAAIGTRVTLDEPAVPGHRPPAQPLGSG